MSATTSSRHSCTSDDETVIDLSLEQVGRSMELETSFIDEVEQCDEEMDTRKSLSGFATLMLPALIDESNRRRPFPNNRLLRNAHTQLLRGAAGVKDIAGRAHEAGRRQVERLQQKPPLCCIIINKAYHKYGLKHLVLILVFLLYTAFGAGIFLLVEGRHQGVMKKDWSQKLAVNRSIRVNVLMAKVFNNSQYLIYVKGATSEKLKTVFNKEFENYERQLGIRWSEQKMEWDFWTALLFAGTICTTIGYGHIYPITNLGKILTMVFALFGIPLMLLVLQDFGKLLTITMKFPWFQTKRIARRVLRCCTKQSLREMREIEELERQELEVFDLPLIVGVSLIVLWVFICSLVLSMWDKKWTLLESFYFFFISLSTVGLGDLVPSSPRLLITMFGFILVGLSLVSMVINLLQMKMKKTYESTVLVTETRETEVVLDLIYGEDEMKKSCESAQSRSTQTSLSLPSIRQVVLRSDGVHWMTETPIKSPDEVTTLVELESGLRVCEQIGDNNNDEASDEDLVDETNVLLDRGESETE